MGRQWRARVLIRTVLAISMIIAGIYWRSWWGLFGIPGLILASWDLYAIKYSKN